MTLIGIIRKAISCVLLLCIVNGCAKLIVKKIKQGEEDGGLVYCLSIPKVQIATKEALVYDNTDLPTAPYFRAARKVTDITATLVQMPDYGHYYSAKIDSGWFTADSYTIGYDANGCFNTYNFATVDQTATAITTVGSIALAAAAVAAAEKEKIPPQVTTADPGEETYRIQRASRTLLNTAEDKIKELSETVAKLKEKKKRSEQEQQELDKKMDSLSSLLDKASKLRDLLTPVPTRILKNEFIGLRFLPDGLSADDYVVKNVQEAENNDNGNKFIPYQNGHLVNDFTVAVARRIK